MPNALRVDNPWPAAVVNGLAAFFLAFVIFWNATQLLPQTEEMVEYVSPLADLFRLDQRWDMFAPYPQIDDGWFVIPAKLSDGREINLLDPKEGLPVWNEPANLAETYPDDRWRSYFLALWKEEHEEDPLRDIRPNTFARQRGPTFKTFEIYYMSKPISRPGRNFSREKRLLWEYVCGQDITR